MKRLLIAAAICLPLGVAPARADGPKLTHFANLFFSGTAGENAPELKMDFATGVTLGTLKLEFEKTKLDDILAVYGGDTHFQGDAGNAVTWLCYTVPAAAKAPPVTVWFTSTSEMSGPGDTLSMLVEEEVDASKTDGCSIAPHNFALPALPLPALGASTKDIKTHFGSTAHDPTGNIYFNSTRPLTDGSGMSVYQSVGYVIRKHALVTGVAISQVTTD